jgi:hypothetical protein
MCLIGCKKSLYSLKKLLFFLLSPSLVFAQDGAFRYFISFTDKVNTDYSINTPEQYLSVRTIVKRQKYGIPNYYNAYQLLNSVINLSQGIPINTLIEYKVYTIDGKEMNNGKTILYNENSTLSFIKPKTAGVYIIHLFTDSFELNKRFIVLE